MNRTVSTIENALGDHSGLARRLRVLCGRLESERFQLAVLGQFKRGKSSFINALLGAAILPTGVVPLTAVATFIRWGTSPFVSVQFQGDAPKQEFSCESVQQTRDVLSRFVAEDENPKNKLRVARVDVLFPAKILRGGTTLIDTPGVGSTLEHNTQTALEVLPECDAAFFVISADPPITECELDYLRQVKSKLRRLFFVLNKVDHLATDERRAAADFLQRVLAESAIIDGDCRIFLISARDALVSKQAGDELALRASGLAPLEGDILDLLAREKARLLEDAVRSKTQDILKLVAAELALRARVLNMPLEELGAKSLAFQQELLSIEEERRITCDLLAGEHWRLRESLEYRVEELRKLIGVKLASAINSAITMSDPKQWEDQGHQAVSLGLEQEFEAATVLVVSEFAAGAGAALRACQGRVDSLANRVKLTAAQMFDLPLGLYPEYERFELGQDPYWVTESKTATLIPDASRLLDWFLPAALRRRRLLARMVRLADELIIRNAENLRWAILLGLDETFRKATAQFEERLDETIAATRGVIRETLSRRHDQSHAIEPDLERLSLALEEINALKDQLKRTES